MTYIIVHLKVYFLLSKWNTLKHEKCFKYPFNMSYHPQTNEKSSDDK